jgi:hypothetical protein
VYREDAGSKCGVRESQHNMGGDVPDDIYQPIKSKGRVAVAMTFVGRSIR